ncbi:MAG: 23S rRNA pseudouridine(2604) synthase RluF [Candidatus Izimaplasma sp.]|nr:23S rRNA pseudouridine(2604) synthase RluF [Candidatus Izimaplasma bacterium]
MAKRINKYLSEAGYCSRRKADRLIKQELVTINGEFAQLGSQVTEEDIIKVDGKEIKQQDKFIYLAFNKPIGITSTTDKKDPTNIVDYINYPKRIFHVGRLDKDSEGLILMTNDGDIVNKILRAENNHEKEYLVTVNKPIDTMFLKGMSEGVPILNTVTKPCKVYKLSRNKFKIVLTEGLNRQIRRMCAFFDYHVEKLQRTRIMNIKLDVPRGKYRHLKETELNELKELLKDSSKEAKTN